jgi:acyl-CoA synthetase (AMP-forming)/AMP-acid ligase II
MGLYDFTFYDTINRNVMCFRDRPAWLEVSDGRKVTFDQFKDIVDRLAKGLQEMRLKKGDRIGILGKNSLEYFLLFGAAAALGAIVLPINCRLSADEVSFNLNDCTPKLVFADEEYQELIEGIMGKLSSVEEYFNLEPAGGNFKDFNTLTKNEGDFAPPEVHIDDGLVIIYTAAVAGRPRGALLSHGNVLYADMNFAYFFNATYEDVHLNLLPLFHVGGLFMATTCFHVGALNINMSRFDVAKAVELIDEKKASFTMVFTPMLSSIASEAENTGRDINSLRAVTGIETPEAIEKYQGSTGGNFWCMYGQTETSCLASISRYNDKPGSVGRPLLSAKVRLVDDFDRPVPVGQVGEIAIKGPMIFKGYWNLPEETNYTFRDGWHHTGDQGRFDEDGFLWYAGRKAEKELIKPGGENVYPVEVEKVILQHPAVERTVVFGVPDPKWKEGIKAICQLKEGQIVEPKEIIDFVGEQIARYKKPQYVEFVIDLPLLKDGTPDRAKVKELYGKNR